MSIKTVKFGGSSLADAAQFEKVKNIISADSDRRFVVPSAPGKRNKSDTKVTDMLYSCYEKAAKGESIDDIFSLIKERYTDIIAALGLDLSLEKEFERIKNSFYIKAGKDYAASRGEYLNGIILAEYIGYDFIDAADVIFFKADGTFDEKRTYDVLSKTLSEKQNAVIPGFYGSMPNDTIKTFSRGGSDITGSIVACASGSDIYENWTDVSGFLAADPRIVEDPAPIRFISYRELRELSYMGATVLHEDAVFPVRKAKIPINVRNTNAPEDPGTMIVASVPESVATPNITGIAGKKGFSVITIEKDMMNQEMGFGKRVLLALENNGVSFEHLPSGIDTMGVVVSTASIEGKVDEIEADIRELVNPDQITVEHDIALIAVVGRGMVRTKGTARKVFDALYKADVNVKMIDQGSSELNIIVGVSSADFEKSMQYIYEAFK